MKNQVILIIIFQLLFIYSCQNNEKRETMSLNGVWKIGEGTMDKAPGVYDHIVRVPGLVSLAVPAFKDAGPRVRNRQDLIQKDTLREAFWYYRRFKIDRNIPAVAMLKVSKAMFGTKVILNGNDLGEHLPCFTPGWFNASTALHKGENEILIRIGSCRGSLPRSIPDGFDFEKERYIPGIFDNVQLILCGTPEIIGVQTAPDITKQQVKVQVRLGAIPPMGKTTVKFVVKEEKSQNVAGTAEKVFTFPQGATRGSLISLWIPVSSCRLWSPEDPFLYNLTVTTGGDEFTTRFGMREFGFDTLSGRPMLNGKPYFIRGSNVTIYRFFEDDSCRDLPWNATWVRKLHKSFKQFHWNGLRYCIGLAPEEWYDIADEEGLIIQNEFPLWYGGKGWCVWPQELKTGELVKEYTEWLQEQWNHPSIVIWDASNETISNDGKTEEVAEAVRAVRGQDLSDRPWDNSYSPVRLSGDVMELHPYHFQDQKFRLKDIIQADTNPGGERDEKRYMKIVNEYGWLWLNRDGSPTTLTNEVYKNILGENSTEKQRRHLYATYMAAETEFWRCHRQCAAVLHFTALGYSRADGQTSDHFTDVANLVYEDEFMKYLPDAFSPVGLMLDEWGKEIKAGAPHNFRIIAINDLEQGWKGKLYVRIFDKGKLLSEQYREISITPFGRNNEVITIKTPDINGLFTVIASLERTKDKPVNSSRELQFIKN
jgi:beta-galactosidase